MEGGHRLGSGTLGGGGGGGGGGRRKGFLEEVTSDLHKNRGVCVPKEVSSAVREKQNSGSRYLRTWHIGLFLEVQCPI